MAFSALADKAITNVGVFVSVDVLDTSTGTTTTLYFSDGQRPAADWVGDGTVREWDGKIRGWEIVKPNQKLGTARHAHATMRLSLWVSGYDDDLWDYLTPDHQWERIDEGVNAWLVDLDQSPGSGSRRQFIGMVGSEPDNIMPDSAFTVDGVGGWYNTRVPTRRLATPDGGWTEYGEARNRAYASISGAVTAAQTHINLSSVGGFGNVTAGDVMVLMDGTGASGPPIPREACYLSGINTDGANASSVDVRRGYGFTSATSHIDRQTAWFSKNGISDPYTKASAYEQQLGFVFGYMSAYRGIVMPMVPYTLQDDHYLFYWTRGSGGTASRSWLFQHDEFWRNIGAENSSFNDYGDSYKFDSAILGTGDENCEPHWQLAGTYFRTSGQSATSGHGPHTGSGWNSEAWDVYARVPGIKNPNNGIYSAAPGIARYLATNSRWACGITSAFHVSAMSNWNAGGWFDEFAGLTYPFRIAGNVPAFDNTEEPPKLADVIAELCDITNSDLFYRGGQWYPKRRTVAATSTATITRSDVIGHIEMSRGSRHKDYINELVAETAQSVLSEPGTKATDVPAPVPYKSVLQDDDEINNLGGYIDGKVSLTISRKWWRFDLSADWKISNTKRQQRHLQWWRAAHAKQLDHRAQAQVWTVTKLPARYLWLEQGDTIEFDDVPGITTRKGQIRDIRITGGQDQPVTLKVRSWHINF